jgi:hypothetical protein
MAIGLASGGRWPLMRRLVSMAGAAILQPVGWPPRPSRPTNSLKAYAPREAGPIVLKKCIASICSDP